ncbi:hypothetical protein H632_c1270p1 [Helicosporidium sp. ATCC 50920]|nr:hypothetical protein H632_c1270p1 [Helicosporidium sp. ATCC 50920]|eukprot:KDD74504.1 hypothetical protein H632_c1270p1 [Helicosporidium sp. ATCC 50920]
MASRASATLFGSSPNDSGWQTAIHATYEKPIWVPATIFLVTDHLHHLLVKNYMRRDKASGTDDERFARCVGRLHIGIFQGYYDWCRHVVLPARIGELQLRSLRTRSPIAVRFSGHGNGHGAGFSS